MLRFLLAVALFTPSLAPAQDQQIRAGTYDLAVVFGGGKLNATLDIAYKGDSITAVLKLSEHQSPVKAGKRTGNKLTLDPTSTIEVRYQLEFNADDVKGTFTYDGENGELTGKRRRQDR